MSALAWDDKDPDEILDYQVLWATRLGSDTISSSTWTVPAGPYRQQSIEHDDHGDGMAGGRRFGQDLRGVESHCHGWRAHHGADRYADNRREIGLGI
jgi:hypothetical protein